MRLALIADIHGNSVALDAVLADIEAGGGADDYWFLGDLVALGPDPLGVLERIDGLPAATCIRGNTDRHTVSGSRPAPSLEDTMTDPAMFERWKEMNATFIWTLGAVGGGGRVDQLASLPTDVRYTLEDGTRVLGVHASPGRDDGDGAHPSHTDDELAGRFQNADADLVFVGHTHNVVDRVVRGIRIVNPGSVSNHPPGVTEAHYAVLESSDSAHEVQLRSVPYDRAAVVAQLDRVRHPGRDFIASLMQVTADADDSSDGWAREKG